MRSRRLIACGSSATSAADRTGDAGSCPPGAHSARLPRLLGPRLPIGPRWLRFCRSEWADHLRGSLRSLKTSLLIVYNLGQVYAVLHFGTALLDWLR